MPRALVVAGVLLLLAALVAFLGHGDRKAIANAQAEAAHLMGERDSLLAVVEGHEAEQAVLTRERTEREDAITALRDSIAGLERERAEGRLATRQIRTTDTLLDRFRAAFPAVDSTVGLTTVAADVGDTLGLEYLMVPAFFAETFLIDRANATSWRAQRDELLVMDSLRAAVAVLQDSITQLTRAEYQAFRAGYDSAYGAYHALNTRYIAELRKPRWQFGSTVGFLLGAGAGIVVGGLVH